MFPEAEADAIDREATELASFLREEVQQIARRAASLIVGSLQFLGMPARRRFREQLADQVLELARHLASYGTEGPRLYGESQRRYAAARLAGGMSLHDALQERAVVQDSILDVWSERHGPLPVGFARLLAMAFAEVSSQTAEVFLTYQRAESVAFQEAALLDTIVHHLDEAILVVEPDGTVSYATPAIEEIVGLPSQVFLGVPPDRLAAVMEPMHPRDREGNPIERKDLPHMQALATRKAQHTDFLRLKRADGSEAVCEAYAAPVFAEEDQLRGVVLTIRDRTREFEQRQALERAFNELQRMHARLLSRSRLEAIGELAGSAAHALNNQLNVITLRLRRLLDQAEARADAAAIERSVREIAGVVARLQEFAAAPRPTNPTEVDVRAIVERALELVRARLGPVGKVPVVANLDRVPTALADHDSLLEFLTALLLGAEDATPPGAAVEVATTHEGSAVVIRVIDRGPTLGAKQVQELFDPLLAVEAERALNFALARQAVQRWGGEVHVQPASGGGNVAEIRLRAFSAAEAPEPVRERPAAPPPAPAERVERVLVVDDDADNAAMLADLVRDAGAEVATAGSGAEAVRVAERLRPQAALVDLLLPDMDGWEVVEALRSRWPDLRVAVVSGLAVGREEREERDVDAVFRKPIDTEELLHFLGS